MIGRHCVEYWTPAKAEAEAGSLNGGGQAQQNPGLPSVFLFLIHGNKDVLHFGIHLECFHAQLASHATLLKAAKGSF